MDERRQRRSRATDRRRAFDPLPFAGPCATDSRSSSRSCLCSSPACGEKDEPEVTGPPVVTDPGGGQNGGEPQGGGGVALEEIGEFEEPGVRHPAQGRQRPVRGRADRPVIRVSAQRQEVDAPRHLRRDHRRRRAGAPLGRLRAGLRAARASSTSTTRTRTATRGSSSTRPRRTARSTSARPGPSSRSTSRTRTTTAACSSSTTTATCSSASATAAPAGDPERNGQDLGALLGKILRIDPEQADKGQHEYSIPKDNPYAGDRTTPGPRSSPTACATLALLVRLEDRSALDRRRRPELAGGDRRARRAGRRRQLRLVRLRGDRALQLGRGGPERDRPGPDLRPRRGLLGHRRLRRPRPGARVALRPLPLRRLLPGPAAELRRRGHGRGRARPPTTRPLGLQVPSISSFGEDQRGRIYAVSLDGPVFRLVPEKD